VNTIIPTEFSTTFTGLARGTTYNFEVCAKNIHGLATNCTNLDVTTANVPSTMSVPVVAQEAGSKKVKISWSEPEDNHSSIISYQIFMKKNLTEVELDFSTCDEES
jgi:hypothetical protein